MIKNTLVLIVLALLLSESSCTTKPKTYLLADEVREALNIKDGSYWIFKDSITGVVDSFWAEGYYLGVSAVDLDQRNSDKHEGISYSIMDSTEEIGRVQSLANFNNDKIINGYFLSYKIVRRLAKLPFVQSEIFEGSYGTTKTIAYYPSFSLLGKSYSEVYHNYSSQVSWPGLTDTAYVNYYYSLESGFIKVAIEKNGDRTVKELLRHTIKK